MVSKFNKQKILEKIFDPDVSEILSELENGGKDLHFLIEKLKISESEINNRLSYLIAADFVKKEKIKNRIIFSADPDKLANIVEQDKNFDDVVDGLAKMDSYLN